MAAKAAGLSIEDYLAKRSTAVAEASQYASGLTPMAGMPATPSLPAIQLPNMAMPDMPTLQPVARMPTMFDSAIDQARKKARETIAQRAGRESTFLTTTTKAAAPPPVIANSVSRYAAKTAG